MGGDFYDFIRQPDGRQNIIISDVSDKGVPAALVMSMTRTLLPKTTELHDSPGTILAAVNDGLAGDIPQAIFVICFYATLDLTAGTTCRFGARATEHATK